MLNKILEKLRLKRAVLFLVASLLFIINFAFLPVAFAGTLTGTSLIELGGASNVNPMIAGDGQSLALAFTTSGSVSSGSYSITLSFGSAWTSASGVVNGSQTASTTGCTALTGATNALPGTDTPSGAGTTITLAMTGSDALSATTSYCTELTSTTAVTNPTAGTYSVTINDSVDSKTVGLDVLSSGGNAYTVSATVASTFTMALNNTTDALGTLSDSAVTYSSGVQTTINTNAASGWFVWARDANAGLTSPSISKTINSVTAGSAYTFSSHTGAENYGLCVGSSYYVAAYNCTSLSTPTTGSGLSNTAFTEIATNSAPASGLTFTTKELADISGTTPPASDYADTITEVGAGSF